MEKRAEATVVPADGIVLVTCGETTTIAVGDKVFHVVALHDLQAREVDDNPEDPVPPGSEAVVATVASADIDRILQQVRDAQAAPLSIPEVIRGPGGRPSLAADDQARGALLDFEVASASFKQPKFAATPDFAVLRAEGCALVMPSDPLDAGQLRALINPES